MKCEHDRHSRLAKLQVREKGQPEKVQDIPDRSASKSRREGASASDGFSIAIAPADQSPYLLAQQRAELNVYRSQTEFNGRWGKMSQEG